MTDDPLRFGSAEYWLMLALLFFARGMDLLSTWVATPNLVLEANPLAKKLGWKLGAIINVILCFTFAFWVPAGIIVITSGLLVAAHNFQAAWLMRAMGEDGYRDWFVSQLSRSRRRVYIGCLLGETAMFALIGAALIIFDESDSIAFDIGMGIAAYAVIVLFYSSLSLWRMRR